MFSRSSSLTATSSWYCLQMARYTCSRKEGSGRRRKAGEGAAGVGQVLPSVGTAACLLAGWLAGHQCCGAGYCCTQSCSRAQMWPGRRDNCPRRGPGGGGGRVPHVPLAHCRQPRTGCSPWHSRPGRTPPPARTHPPWLGSPCGSIRRQAGLSEPATRAQQAVPAGTARRAAPSSAWPMPCCPGPPAQGPGPPHPPLMRLQAAPGGPQRQQGGRQLAAPAACAPLLVRHGGHTALGAASAHETETLVLHGASDGGLRGVGTLARGQRLFSLLGSPLWTGFAHLQSGGATKPAPFAPWPRPPFPP
jgi:hypothetical protein